MKQFSCGKHGDMDFFQIFILALQDWKKRRGIHFNKYFKFYLQLKSEYCNKHFP